MVFGFDHLSGCGNARGVLEVHGDEGAVSWRNPFSN